MAHYLLGYFPKFTPLVSQVHFAKITNFSLLFCQGSRFLFINSFFVQKYTKSLVIFLAHSSHLNKKAHLKNAFLGVKIHKTNGCVTLCGLAIHIKTYVKAKEEELWKLKYFPMQKYNLQKIL
jgi:CMP-N-acetylneuraminic acid synthetase